MTEIKLDLSKIIKQVSDLEQRINSLVQTMPGFARAVDNVGSASARAEDMLTHRGASEAQKATGLVGPNGQPISTGMQQPRFTGPNTVQAFDPGTLSELKTTSKAVSELTKVIRDLSEHQKVQLTDQKNNGGIFGQLTKLLKGGAAPGAGAAPASPGPAGLLDKLKGAIPSLAAMGVAGGVAKAIETARDVYLGTQNGFYGNQIALGQATVRAPMEKAIAEGNLAQKEFSRRLGSIDATSAENLVRYRADLLNPNEKFNYLGTKGFRKAVEDAGTVQSKELGLEKTQGKLASTNFGANSLTNIALAGAAGVGAGALVGSVVPGLGTLIGGAIGGVLGVAGGVMNVASEAPGFLKSQAENRANAMSGELDKGLVGLTGRVVYGSEWSKMTKDKRDSVNAQLQLGRFDMAQDLVDSEMKKNRGMEVGVQGQLDMVQAQKEGAISVGRFAMTRKEMEGVLMGSKSEVFLGNLENSIKTGSQGLSKLGSDWDKVKGESFNPLSKKNPLYETVDSITSQLEMSPSEFMSKSSQMTNYLGVGQKAGVGATADMIRLGRSGMGDFSQLMGNIGQLNKVSGGQDNTNLLKDVLTSAVSIGFDKSRIAQAFVTTSTSLAQSLGVTNVAGVAESLAIRSQALGVDGKADERSMAEAAKGMQAFDNSTKGLQGVGGVTKMANIFGTGTTVGTGAGIASRMSASQLTNAMKDIDSGKDVKQLMENPELRDLLNVKGGDIGKVRNLLSATYTGVTRPIAGIMNMITRGSTTFQQKLQEIGKLKEGAGKTQEFQKILSSARDVGEATTIGGEGAAGFIATEAERLKIFERSGSADKMFNEARKKGFDTSVDKAAQNTRKYIDGLIATQIRGESISLGDYKKALDRDDVKITPLKVGGRDATNINIAEAEERSKTGDKEAQKFLDGLHEKLSGGAGFDIAREASVQASVGDTAQPVRVMNFNEFLGGMGSILMNDKMQRVALGNPVK